MKRIISWFLLLSFIGLLLFVVAKPVRAQDKTFTIGVPIMSQALFCHDLESAKVIANNKGAESPEIEVLMFEKKCFGGTGIGIYVKEVYRKGTWAVWEFTIGNKSFYEPTDWKGVKPPPKGQMGV